MQPEQLTDTRQSHHLLLRDNPTPEPAPSILAVAEMTIALKRSSASVTEVCLALASHANLQPVANFAASPQLGSLARSPAVRSPARPSQLAIASDHLVLACLCSASALHTYHTGLAFAVFDDNDGHDEEAGNM